MNSNDHHYRRAPLNSWRFVWGLIILLTAGHVSAQQNPPVEVEGTWTYRSFLNDPDLSASFDSLRFGAGTMTFEKPANGVLKGRLSFGGDTGLDLSGTVTGSDPVRLRFQGNGGPPPPGGPWVYDYVAFVVPNWPGGVGQRPALVGSIIRTVAHSGGQAPAGFVASWIAVKQDPSNEEANLERVNLEALVAAISPSGGTRSEEQAAAERLRKSWADFYAASLQKPAPPATTARMAALESLAPLPAPQRLDLVAISDRELPRAKVLRSSEGVLDVELAVEYAENTIGPDKVWLRSYNRGLVGPTLMVKPGDTLRVKLVNKLPPEAAHTGDHNEMHGWNTTNLHTHGLHVSPSGNSDNVFLEVKPQESQNYVIEIPEDHPAGTFWYHAHKHGSTAAHVSSGMAGAIIIEGGIDTVPEIKAAKERTMLFQQVPYILETRENGTKIGVVEKKYADEIFGPGTWDALGRFTTINGEVLPTIKMRPGEIQRWRLVHAGVRDSVVLRLARNDGTGLSGDVDFHELAVDGLAFGKRVSRNRIELHPGYRSDVLVKAPMKTGEYVLADERKMRGGVELPKKRKYLARVIVSGDEKDMALPANADLAPHKGVKESLVGLPAGSQDARYAILPKPGGGGVLFTVNEKPFDSNRERILKLGTVDEWTLSTGQQTFPVDHPFHIHVNPFEVISMVPPGPNAQNVISEPVWRDTLMIPHGWTIKVRTRYDVFPGSFVQHCHILDHEDQGMMEKVTIVDESAAAGTETGGERLAGLEDPNAFVLVFIRGLACAHCNDQVAEFSELAGRFREQGIQLIGFSSDSEALAGEAASLAFPLISDPGLERFHQFRCVEKGEPLHGVFVLDREGKVTWSNTGAEPYMDVEAVLARGKEIVSLQNVEMQKTAVSVR